MITLTVNTLKNICPYAKMDNLTKYVGYINSFLPEYEINSLLRIRHFIAQVAHESGSFNYVEELASGKEYEYRKDLGNTQYGDGVKYKGRGLIQITGRGNYSMLSLDFNVDFVDSPELLETPEYAVRSACWFWKRNNLNELADNDDITRITKKINGGTNGINDRVKLYNLAKKYINES